MSALLVICGRSYFKYLLAIFFIRQIWNLKTLKNINNTRGHFPGMAGLSILIPTPL
jgi:hypothetical protein